MQTVRTIHEKAQKKIAINVSIEFWIVTLYQKKFLEV